MDKIKADTVHVGSAIRHIETAGKVMGWASLFAVASIVASALFLATIRLSKNNKER